MAINDPISHNLTAAASTVGSWQLPVFAHLITVTNEGTAAAFVTVSGTVPTVNGDDTYYIPVGGYGEIPIIEPLPAEASTAAKPTVQGISSAALSLWVAVNQ